MTEHDLEHRLRADAERLEAVCPPYLRQRVAARLRDRSFRRPHRWPVAALAGAVGVFVAFAAVRLLWQPAEVENATPRVADLNAAPVVASSDRLLASREAALENERQLLERDLRNLRDQVTATFEFNSNG